ncbi:hypothetical protein ACFWXZ_13535 [[Kitasatospora] papulosa]
MHVPLPPDLLVRGPSPVILAILGRATPDRAADAIRSGAAGLTR